jgi:HEAT repeat protein
VSRPVLILALLAGLAAHAQKTPDPVARAVAELQNCHAVDDPVCRGIPVRLANWGKHSVGPLLKGFSELPRAGQLLGVVALKDIPHASAQRGLIRLAQADGDLIIRLLAVDALGDRTGRAVDKALIRLLRSDNPAVRAAAAEALGKLPSERTRKTVVPALLDASGDKDSSVERSAIASLGMLGDKRGVPVAVAALQSPDKAVQRAALFALRFLNDVRAAPQIMELLKARDRALVQEAGRTLEKLTGLDFGIDYALWKGWWAEKVLP